MSKKLEPKPDYTGLTINERLLISGQLDLFDNAARKRDRRQMISLLQEVSLTERYAAHWVDALLGDQKFFYF